MHNDLSIPILRKFIFIPVLFKEIRERFNLNPMISGSGSCCFTIIPEGFDVNPVLQVIIDAWGNDIFITETRMI